MATATAPTLTTTQARKLLRLDGEITAVRRQLESLERDRRQLRESLADRVPLDEVLEVGGVRVKRREKRTGRSFRLKAYLDKGHKVTAAMRPFVGQPTLYEDWQVKELAP